MRWRAYFTRPVLLVINHARIGCHVHFCWTDEGVHTIQGYRGTKHVTAFQVTAFRKQLPPGGIQSCLQHAICMIGAFQTYRGAYLLSFTATCVFPVCTTSLCCTQKHPVFSAEISVFEKLFGQNFGRNFGL
jgi:hypothetical protein